MSSVPDDPSDQAAFLSSVLSQLLVLTSLPRATCLFWLSASPYFQFCFGLKSIFGLHRPHCVLSVQRFLISHVPGCSQSKVSAVFFCLTLWLRFHCQLDYNFVFFFSFIILRDYTIYIFKEIFDSPSPLKCYIGEGGQWC